MCIVKMFSHILFGQIRPATNQLMSIPLICQCYIRPGAGPSTIHYTPKCSLIRIYICHFSPFLSGTKMQSESAPFFNTRMLPISVYSENVVPRPAFCACFMTFVANARGQQIIVLQARRTTPARMRHARSTY